MFDKLSPAIQDLLAKELANYEKEHFESKEKNKVTLARFGALKYTALHEEGEVPVYVDFNEGAEDAAVIKTTDGLMGIFLSPEFVSSSDDDLFYGALAHELGHILEKHLETGGISLPNLHFHENMKAVEEGDQEKHSYLSSLAVAQGGYLIKEMQADLVACKFTSVEIIQKLHLRDIIKHSNPLARLEKINRLTVLANTPQMTVTQKEQYTMTFVPTVRATHNDTLTESSVK